MPHSEFHVTSYMKEHVCIVKVFRLSTPKKCLIK